MVDDYKITVLSDMIPGLRTVAEWGFSALIEIRSAGVSKRFLFDTGANPQTVLANAKTLNISICDIEDVILSHNHWDHTTGLGTLRSSCSATNPDAFKNAYIGGEEIFWPRIGAGTIPNYMVDERPRYLAQGGTFILNTQPTPQFLGLPGVWLTGKISRKHDEKTYPGTPNIQDPAGKLSSDVMPEEISLVINKATGMVLVTGCAHAGIINTIEAAQAILGDARPPVSIVGGIHFYPLPLGEENTEGIEGTLIWEANQMLRNGVIRILGSHCTGLERFVFLRDFLGLDDSEAVFGSVGTRLSMSEGFGYTLPAAVNKPLRPKWETQLQSLACGGTKPPTPSCQVSVSGWNYYLLNFVSSMARNLVTGTQSMEMMTVQQYLAARTAAGM
jgi:7,8-dihydropterin-6-yl-methyl-4-(beta-D-ribofuranosyl)aminobenzene 5'-phosphate synthase